MSPSLVSRISPSEVLVEAPDREDSLAVIDEVDDVAGDVTFGGAGDSDRLVQRDVDRACLLASVADAVTVEAHVIALFDLRAEGGGRAVDGHATLRDQGVGFATRACAALAQVFVETHDLLGSKLPQGELPS